MLLLVLGPWVLRLYRVLLRRLARPMRVLWLPLLRRHLRIVLLLLLLHIWMVSSRSSPQGSGSPKVLLLLLRPSPPSSRRSSLHKVNDGHAPGQSRDTSRGVVDRVS